MNLQITSMADIFMILLVFLLKSVSSGTIDVAPSNGTELPMAQASEKSVQALKVEVSEKAVLVEGRPGSSMTNFRFDPSDVSQSGVSKSLSSALEQERAKQQGKAGEVADPRIVVIADQRAPYQTIKTVLASAANEGYTDVKLAVIHED
jgi:biopolymer transport protein ExbD